MAKKIKAEQLCVVCGEQLPMSKFYKDGTNKAGIKYRKDCKDCYKKARDKRELAKTLPDAMTLVEIKHVE